MDTKEYIRSLVGLCEKTMCTVLDYDHEYDGDLSPSQQLAIATAANFVQLAMYTLKKETL